jgi:hypothetical protein
MVSSPSATSSHLCKRSKEKDGHVSLKTLTLSSDVCRLELTRSSWFLVPVELLVGKAETGVC